MRRIGWLVVVAVLAVSCDGAEVATTPTSAPPSSAPDASTTSLVVTTTQSRGGGSTTTTLDPEVPRRGGSVVVGLPFVPADLNELDDDGFAAARWIRNLLRPAAYVIQPDGTRIPHLVTGDPSFDDGGLFIAEDGSFEVTWRIDLQARWSDGERVSSADFALFHEAECDEDEDDLEVEFLDADPGQVRVRFPRPTPRFREAVEHVMPAHVIDARVACFDDGVTWPSTGPFVIDSVTSSGIELVRNPSYWRTDPATGTRLPYLDSLTLRNVEDLEEALESRAVDVADASGLLASEDRSLPNGVLLETAPGAVWEFVTFQFGPDNRNETSLNQHLEFRQALIHGIDRVALAAAVEWLPSDGLGAASPLQAWASYDSDPREAASLLEDLCLELERDCETNPPKVVFTTTADSPERAVVAGLLEEMWEELGIDVELQLEDSGLLFGETAPLGTYDLAMWAWIIDPDPVSRLDTLGVFDPNDPGPGGRNWYRWGAPRSGLVNDPAVVSFRDVIARAARAIEMEVVLGLLGEAEQLVADEVVVIPIATRPVAIVRRADLMGPTPTVTSLGLLWNAESWFVSTASG